MVSACLEKAIVEETGATYEVMLRIYSVNTSSHYFLDNYLMPGRCHQGVHDVNIESNLMRKLISNLFIYFPAIPLYIHSLQLIRNYSIGLKLSN